MRNWVLIRQVLHSSSQTSSHSSMDMALFDSVGIAEHARPGVCMRAALWSMIDPCLMCCISGGPSRVVCWDPYLEAIFNETSDDSITGRTTT